MSFFKKIKRIFKKKKHKSSPMPVQPPPPAPIAEKDPFNPADFKEHYEPEFRRTNVDDQGIISDLARKYHEDHARGRQEGRQYADEFFDSHKNEPGIDPQQRLAMQEAANREITRNMQSQNRSLLGKQGAKGVRGGVNFAQQNELARNANQSRIQSENDLRNIDEDMKYRRLAAKFNIEQGLAGQNIFNRQAAEDSLTQYRQRLKDEMERKRFSKLFTI